MFFPFTGLEFITNQTGDQQMIGKKNRVKMKEPCGAIKERRLIRSRIQHRRQNLFHTSRKFKTKQNPINWKKYNANLWRKFPKSYVVAMSAVCCLLSGRARSFGCLRNRSSEWFYRRNWSHAIASNDAMRKSTRGGGEIQWEGGHKMKSWALLSAVAFNYFLRFLEWPGLANCSPSSCEFLFYLFIIIFNVFSFARKKE